MPFLDEDPELGSEYTLRHPKKTDIEAINKLYVESWLTRYADWGLGWSKQRILNEFHQDALPLNCWTLLEYNGELVGFLRHSRCGRKLEHIIVQEAYWRTGGGYRLLDAYLEKVQELWPKGTWIFLEIFLINERGRAFFSRYGYKPTGLRYQAATSRQELLTLAREIEGVVED